MEGALIVSGSEKAAEFLAEMLAAAGLREVGTVKSCGEARRMLLARDFDLVIVDAPLRDESGEDFARSLAAKSLSQVIMTVNSELFEAVSAACEDDGVLTVSKPVNRAVLWSALKLAGAARSRMRRMREENSRLKQKIEDIRVIDRAKCLLISHLGLSEGEAHRYIEKQAMDMRRSRRSVAEGLLKTYEN